MRPRVVARNSQQTSFKSCPRCHGYLQRRSRGSRERLFNACFTGNQPDFLLIDLDANFADELANDSAAARRVGLMDRVGQPTPQASVVLGNAGLPLRPTGRQGRASSIRRQSPARDSRPTPEAPTLAPGLPASADPARERLARSLDRDAWQKAALAHQEKPEAAEASVRVTSSGPGPTPTELSRYVARQNGGVSLCLMVVGCRPGRVSDC